MQVESLLQSPHLIQYLVEHAIHTMIQNGTGLDGDVPSGDFIRGLNRGTLLFLNSLFTQQFVSGNLSINGGTN